MPEGGLRSRVAFQPRGLDLVAEPAPDKAKHCDVKCGGRAGRQPV